MVWLKASVGGLIQFRPPGLTEGPGPVGVWKQKPAPDALGVQVRLHACVVVVTTHVQGATRHVSRKRDATRTNGPSRCLRG